ncbi:30S ribosomal protein S19e [Candidatus Woesearchaeota archaeon]|nr:30S ribosomal protein S19e [Candidatus Woesearchaeota archaeon]
MSTYQQVDSGELIEKAAAALAQDKAFAPPPWARFVKTGMHKERPPAQENWWHCRTASILRKIALLGPIGTEKLRRKYGGRKNRGVAPEHFYKGSGSIVRKALQQLEKAGMVKQDPKSKYKGRIITAKGKKFLNDIARQMLQGSKKE